MNGSRRTGMTYGIALSSEWSGMRILVVQESDWIKKGPHQGHHIMERLAERGHEIRVIDYEIMWRNQENRTLWSNRTVWEGFRKATQSGGVTVLRPAIIRMPILDYASIMLTHSLEIRKQIAEFKPDVLVGFGILNARAAIMMGKKKGIPFVYYIIDELNRLVPEKSLAGLARYLESSNMKAADIVISINDTLRDYTVKMGTPIQKTRVVKAGIDLDRFNPRIDGLAIRKQLRIEAEDTVLLFVGWLYPFSGLDEVAVALSRYQKEYSNLKLVIVGRGDQWKAIKGIIAKDNLYNRIKMVDWQPYDVLPRYIAAADICILPAKHNAIMENIVPIKMYEYMGSAKPVITTRLPGIINEFGFESGVYYVDKPEDVLKEAARLIKEKKIVSSGLRAREFVDGRDWDRVVAQFEALLGELA